MSTSSDPAGERWVDFEQKTGTTVLDFYQFVEQIIDSIGDGTPARRRCFTMDNLAAHRNRMVVQLIIDRGHRVVFRAPYYAVDGAIEYFFNTLQHDLTIKLPMIKKSIDFE